MRESSAKTCFHILLAVILAAGVVAIATNNSVAVAQQPCQLQLGEANVSMQQYYYGGNLQLTLPVSASCSFYAGQLYATGSAYDTTYGTNLGTTQTVLGSTYGGYGYTGQLSFTVPPSAQGHSVQFWVSIYGGQNGYYGGYYGGSGSLLAQASSTFVVNPIYYQGYPAYPSYPSYPNYPTYPSYPSYPSFPQYPQYPQYPYYPGYYYGSPYYWFYYRGGYRYHYYCRSWSNNNYCYWSQP